MTESDAPELADCIVEALSGHDLEAVKHRVIGLAQRFNRMRFTLDSI
jgi:hypothetical protein